MIKKAALIFLALVGGVTGFCDSIFLENRTSYPSQDQKSKIAIQWASSAKEVAECNSALICGSKWPQQNMETVTSQGKFPLTPPQKAEYFRVLVWSSGQGEPDLITNWVEIVPHKNYILETDHLVPTVLMIGMGC